MRRLLSLETNEQKVVLRSDISIFLAGFSYPWLLTSELYENPISIIRLSALQRDGLQEVLKESLQFLVEKLYTEPSERQLSIHASRFEKMELNGSFYYLNYRMEPGRLMYTLFSMLNFIIESESNGLEILLTLEPLVA
ncbi:MAG: hypothetical protein EOO60_05450 [Hymenobacter sp.]|nr:MAG: hypothetical protein EOO60_05450 [Hymenobacter sp.]